MRARCMKRIGMKKKMEKKERKKRDGKKERETEKEFQASGWPCVRRELVSTNN